MWYNKMPVPFVALLMTAACGNAQVPTDSLQNNFRCYACGANGKGIYEDFETNSNFGLQTELSASNWVLLGFRNGMNPMGNIGQAYVKSYWGKANLTWGQALTYTYIEMDVEVGTLTYGGVSGYTLKSILTNNAQVLTVVIHNTAGDTTVSGASLANLLVVVRPPGMGATQYDIQFAAAATPPAGAAGFGDPWDNTAGHHNGNETLKGYLFTTRYHGAGGTVSWNPYCALGDNPPDGGNGNDYVVPLPSALFNHGNGTPILTGTDYTTLACRGGALGVMTDMGYVNGVSGMSYDILHAAVLAKTLMPCNDGWIYTTSSLTYRFADNMSPHIQNPGSNFNLGSGQNYELYWNELGASKPNNNDEGGIGNDRHYKVGSATWDQTETSGSNWCQVGIAKSPSVTVPTTNNMTPAWKIVSRPCDNLP